MSAIFGIFHRDGRPVNPEELARMQAALAHRGPDGAGAWHDGPAGLGQLMLHTTPESLNEHLPLLSRDGRLALTADARLDNRDELIAALDLRDRPAARLADSELILAAYERWGERCVERLLGDFAFAVWDRREQQLFCARDHMGVKPFYYYYSDRLVAFASEIKGLLALPQVPRRLNEVCVADHLALLFEDPCITFYQDIVRLPAATTLLVTAAQQRTQRYWTLDPTYELRLGSDQEYAEAFRAIFSEAVRCRLASAYPVGALLSGGLDSSSIACTARDLLGAQGRDPLHTFSAVFPDLPESERRRIDERVFRDTVLASGAFVAHEIRADQLSPMGDLARMHWHQDEAFFGPNLYIHWALHGAARQQGVRVLLDGTDGDTTVSHGWERLAELARRGRWWQLYQQADACARHYRSSRWWFIAQLGFAPLVPEPVTAAWQTLRGRRQPPWGDRSVIHPDFARRIGLAERVAAFSRPTRNPWRSARQKHAAALSSPLLSSTLELADKVAAGCGIEARYPFFDRRLIEFCLSLPVEQKLHNGWDRIVMRRAMEGVLPPVVQWRKIKANLSPNFQLRLLACERERLEAVLHEHVPLVADFVDLAALRQAYQQYAGQPEQFNSEAIMVYTVANLALWLHSKPLTRDLSRPEAPVSYTEEPQPLANAP